MRSREISFTKSFRFKIIVYSLSSLFLTVCTEGAGIAALCQLGIVSRNLREDLANSGSAFHSAAGSIGNAAADMIENSMGSRMGREAGRNAARSLEELPEFGIGLPHFVLFFSILLLAGVALFIAYFLLLSRKMCVSLAKIAVGIERIAAGDLNTRVQIDGKDEFALIGEKLNCMAVDIRIIMENERRNERIKDNLITNVTHDLRTPLTSVIGYLDLLVKNPDLEEKTRNRYVEIAYDKSIRLQKLIEDLFSYTKVSQGEVEPDLKPLDIVKLMEQMVDEFYPSFQEAQLSYEFLTESGSIMVMADGNLLARAFSNLIGNAVKYGRDGKNIRIRICNKQEYVSVSVTNYGRVIPKKDLEYIFERFYRVEGSRSEKTGGTGLGLAIARRIILMHGGTITADSGMEGTTFEVMLKVMNQEEEAYEKKEKHMAGTAVI